MERKCGTDFFSKKKQTIWCIRYWLEVIDDWIPRISISMSKFPFDTIQRYIHLSKVCTTQFMCECIFYRKQKKRNFTVSLRRNWQPLSASFAAATAWQPIRHRGIMLLKRFNLFVNLRVSSLYPAVFSFGSNISRASRSISIWCLPHFPVVRSKSWENNDNQSLHV